MRPLPDGSLHSRTLGLILKPEETRLRLIEASTGEALLRIAEEHDARLAAQRHAAEEAAQRAEAERRAQEEAERRETAERLARDTARRTLAATLLRLLKNRDLSVSDEARQRIENCPDPRQLERWLDQTFSVDDVEDIWTRR